MGDSVRFAISLPLSIARIRGLENGSRFVLGLTPQALRFRLLRRLEH